MKPDHKDAQRISSQPDGSYDHRAVVNLKACYLERDAQLTKLRELAKAVFDRWNTPLWKDVPATANYIKALRVELEE